jgi:hypothetical protein
VNRAGLGFRRGDRFMRGVPEHVETVAMARHWALSP